MNNFIYYTPTKVYFGKDEHLKIGVILKDLNVRNVLLIYGQGSVIKSGLLNVIKKKLDEFDIHYFELGGIIPNPTLDKVYKGIEIVKRNSIDFILCIGGGSVIDTGKDIANGVINDDIDVWDYSLGKVKPTKTLKKGAILTISAAGSEMSDSCVITNTKTQEKRGYCSELNRLDFVIENPELTYSVSPYQTACGIVDIAMHTIERYFCPGEHSEVTDGLALSLIKNVFIEGRKCLDNPNDYDSRSNLMWASSLAHNGLTGCGRSFQLVVHQFEHELSGLHPEIAHGAGLAALWCSWARYVYKNNLERWHQYMSYVWDSLDILEGINKQEEYYRSINMPISLKELGIKENELEKLALLCSRNKSRKLSGYKELDYFDILAIYKLAY